jgi:hypothetical protein
MVGSPEQSQSARRIVVDLEPRAAGASPSARFRNAVRTPNFRAISKAFISLARIRNAINGDTPQGNATYSAELPVHGHRLGLPQATRSRRCFKLVRMLGGAPTITR